jgi:type IV pilus assembly protein PilQ
MKTTQIRYKTGFNVLLASLLLGALCSPALAAELKSISWENGASPALHLTVDGKTSVTTESLENGLRLRVVLKNTSLGEKVSDIAGRGDIKGVFPYVAADGKSTNVDILMAKPGDIAVTAVGDGYRVAARKAPGNASSAAANSLKNIKFHTLAGGRLQIDIQTSSQPAEPGSFSIAKPARVALDFFNTSSAMGNKTIPVNAGAVESIDTIQAGGRTRVVLNLVKPVEYETKVRPDGLTVLVGSTSAVEAQAESKAVRFAKPDRNTKHALKNVDFRRSPGGAGELIVTMSDDSVGIDITEQKGEIVVDFINTSVPEPLERSLDVIDFATPVQTVDTYQHGKNTRLVLKAVGKYEHLAYQAGETFTVDVKPLTQKEEQKRKANEYGFTGDKLSLNFQDIPVRSALQVIADFTGLNFVTSDTVKGNVTLRLKDVPWDQALDVILRSKGLAMRRSGDVVWVGTAEEIAEKEKQQLEAQKSVADLEPLVSELIPINYAKAGNIAKLLKSIKAVDTGIQTKAFASVSIANVQTESNSLLSPRGNVTVDARTNSILVQDTAAKIRDIKKLIAKLDRPVRQVMVETRIVEANDDFSKSLGARFGVTNRNRTVNLPGSTNTNLGDGILTGRLENTEGIYNRDQYLVNGDGLMVDLPSGGLLGDRASSLAFTLFKISSTHLLALELSALEAEGNGKVIASPRLVTANQKPAKIRQGQQRIFPPSGFSDSPTIIEALLELNVTPQITPEHSIILDVDIRKNSFVAPDDPTIDTKQIVTQVLLDNGETVVIGGIYQQDQSSSVSKTPFFGDLPIVGALFRKKNSTNNKTELLIFLTPRIISPELNHAKG